MAAMTLGCKANQYDTGVITDSFIRDGYQIADFDEGQADVYVVNTCTVTALSDRKSRQMIRRARARNPDSFVVAAGCYPQSSPDEAARIRAGGDADLVIGTGDRMSIPQRVRELAAVRCAEGAAGATEAAGAAGATEATEASETPEAPENAVAGSGVIMPDIWKINGFGTPVTNPCTENTRAYIKIQDGCNNYCSYCVIPYVRGRKRSKPPEEVVEEAVKIAAAGFAEVVLTGICLSDYGEDLGSTSLTDIISRICEVPGIIRIRLGSLEPAAVNHEFAEFVASQGKICPHFHISLQSGCDTVLERMNRHYKTSDYRKAVMLILDKLPEAAVTTDVITGFPGETDDEFKQTVEFLESLPLSRMHIFRYSRRKGTKADGFTGQVPPGVKEARSRLLLELSERKSLEFNRRAVGKRIQVLIEKRSDDDPVLWEGLTGNYIRVVCSRESALSETAEEITADLKGRFVDVRVERAYSDHVEGRMILLQKLK